MENRKANRVLFERCYAANMLPWKLTAPVSESLADVAVSPQALAGLDPVSPHEIGSSATDFRS